ncbi:anthranilate synthase component II [Phyllobacterium endophyticum]|uniref:Aminodeoxychorismate/anthranilate synthase component II n=1 Tax=Phyllobacterium endophyticum TaxID=1149773 RepID=A0A2P7AVC6_9HYPH|nr:aminodeoxychorismate/anthranilate synthase component II [Phyllobacterium endophyticum]MBB3234662.1 anthranilate synthase component 2/para-aminobenzoate synthetase component 2 [Phyllobacterium endophyticum]PSH58123.1 aminodeoxychorismate/anthranilate synthase component II [Phyllobacterium endophyticum]TYR38796.1 aminodeoxychorismate/anthranilate synthase component II [Phyllobacterium endophyticum]
MILIIDNYDSFVFTVARYFTELGVEVQVLRNDAITAAEVEKLRPDAIVVSPGPCGPREAGHSMQIIERLSGQVPILGICLGHQCIGEVFGGKVVRAQEPMHGRSSAIDHDGTDIFKGLPSPFRAGRYHSLIVESVDGSDLSVTARSSAGEIMGLAHVSHPTFGVQFHPESVLTEYGHAMLGNFLRLSRAFRP